MSKIVAINLIPLRAPLRAGHAYGSARGLATARQATIVQLRTDDPVEGLGEAWGPPRVTQAYFEVLRPRLLGREIHDTSHVATATLAEYYHFGIQNQMLACLSGIDVAALDAIGKLYGVPVARLLGGIGHTELPIYASGGYVTENPEKDFPAMLDRLISVGARAAKIKIGLNAQSDVARSRAARAKLGDDALLIVDANGNYTVDEAAESMRKIAPYDIHWYEEPLAPQDVSGYAELKRRAPMAIAAGEALYTVWDFNRLLERRAIDVVQPDITLCGGLRVAREVALLAHLHHVRLSPHVWGGAIGLAAACHFVASLPDYPHGANVPYPPFIEYDVGDNPLRDDLLKEPIRPKDGHLHLPEGPGLGVDLDEEMAAHYRLAD